MKKSLSGVIASAMILTFAFGGLVQNTSAATNAELEALIAQLTAQLAALTGGSTTTTTTTTSTTEAGEYLYRPNKAIDYEFTQTLKMGSRGTEVTKLQQALDMKLEEKGIAYGYFGGMTGDAVKAFQVATGYTGTPIAVVGPYTQGKLNAKAAVTTTTGDTTGTTTPVTVTGDKLVVVSEPAVEKLVGASQRVIFAKLTLKAGDTDVEVKDIKVEAEGSADDDVIDKVLILDASKVKIDDDSLDSDAEGKVDVDVTVEAGETVILYVAADMAADSDAEEAGVQGPIADEDGLTISVKLTDIITDGADVEGVPAMGATHTVKDNVTVESFTTTIEREETSVAVNDKDAELYTITIDNPSAGTDDFTLKALEIEQIGTADTKDDLDDLKIKFDGKTYKGTVDEDDEDVYTFDFGDGITVEDGEDVELVLTADIEEGLGSNIKFKVNDTVVEDEDWNILASAEVTAANEIEIDPATTTVGKTSDVTNEDIAAGTDMADLASFDLEVEGGENIEADVEVNITIDTTNTDMDEVELTNVAIYTKDGDLISEKEDLSFDNATATATVNFSNVEFDYDEDEQDFVIKADISKDALNDTTYTIVDIALTNIETESGDSISTVAAHAANLGHVQTVAGTVLEVKLQDADETTINRDADDQIVAEIELDATDSGDDVKVTKIGLTFDSTSTVDIADVKTCELFDGSSSVSNKEDADADMEFDVDVTITKDTTKTLTVQCNIDDSASDAETVKFTMTEADNFEATGDVTKQELDAASTGTSSATIEDGELKAASKDADSPEAQLVKDGDSNVVLGILKVEADKEEITIDDIQVKVANFDNIDGKVEIYVGTDRKGTVSLDATGKGDLTNLNITIADGATEKLIFKADVQDGTDEAVLTVTEIKLEDGDAYDAANNNVSVEDLKDADDTTGIAFEDVTVVAAIPVLTQIGNDTLSVSESLVSDQNVLEFTVKADDGDVTVDEIMFNLTLNNGMKLDNAEVKVYSDAAHSNEVETKTFTGTATEAALTVTFDTPVTITDGDTYYFMVEADVQAASGSSAILKIEDATAKGVIFTAPAGVTDSSLLLEDDIKTTVTTTL